MFPTIGKLSSPRPQARRKYRTSRSAFRCWEPGKLDELDISNSKNMPSQLPSVTFQSSQPATATVYMRGIATGGDDSDHSGSLPTVGTYLDEQPVTTIDGTLDVHIYDIARSKPSLGLRAHFMVLRARRERSTSSPQARARSDHRPRRRPRFDDVDHGGIHASWKDMINLRSATISHFGGRIFRT